MTDLETLVCAAYVFADDAVSPGRRPGRPAKVTDAELIALACAQAVMGITSDRQFLGVIGFRLWGWFPHLPDQTQYNRRLRGLSGVMLLVQQRLSVLVADGRVRIADGTLIGCANYAGCASRSDFAGHASYGYCASKSQWVWGMRLVVITDRRGVPLGWRLVAAKDREYEPVYQLAVTHPGTTLVADKGLCGRAYQETLRLVGVNLITPDRRRDATNLDHEQRLASIRLAIESVYANLKGQMRLEQHAAKTPSGLAQRIAMRLLALTLGILLNTLAGHPPRNLVAYDGR